jgi:hypothetical protein
MTKSIYNDISILERTITDAGITIRTADCYGNGGLVRINGRRELIIPDKISDLMKKELYINCIKELNADCIKMPPRARQLIGEDGWNE